MTRELAQREKRSSDFEGEASTFARLIERLTDGGHEGLSEVLEAALTLCRAGSAALAFCEQQDGCSRVRWRAITGRLQEEAGPLMGTESVACGEILKVQSVQLIPEPARVFPELSSLNPAITEALTAPVELEHRKAGVLWVFAHSGELRFDAEDARLLERVARLAALAFGLERHLQQVQHAREMNERHLKLLWHCAQVLLTADSADEMLQRLFQEIRGELGIDAYFNFMVSEGGQDLELASFAGISVEDSEHIRHLDFGQAICGTVALDRLSVIASDIQHSNDLKVQLIKGYGIRAYACNPLLFGEGLLGTLSFASRQRDRFSVEDVDLFRIISRYVAVAYERLRLIERLREADRRKDEFLAMLAHELRNPLAPIRNSLQFLKRRVRDPDLQSAQAVMERQVLNMVRLVDDLLEVSRVTHGRINLQKAPVTLAFILEQALEAARPVLEAASHEVRTELPSIPVFIEGDATRLAQVFLNLLNNAAKYTLEHGHIEIRAVLEDHSVCVSVKDDGVGIPPAMLANVFDLFTQVENSRGHARGGLGIGLTLVKRLVELHGGSVEARSAGENMGSEFLVRLPTIRGGHVTTATTAGRSAPVSPAHIVSRVLAVDDNYDAVETLAVMLRLEGYQVHIAHDGATALRLAQEVEPHFVLLDIGLPGMSGYEVGRRLRAADRTGRLRIIAVTGWGQAADRQRSREAGFDAHLVKPVDPDRLVALLRSLASTPLGGSRE